MDDAPTPEDRMIQLTHADFLPLVGSDFVFSLPDGTAFTASLLDVQDQSLPDGRHGPVGARAPFSLSFRPADGSAHPQGPYTIATEGFAPLEVFFVPGLGHDGAPVLQATFN